MDIRYEPKVEGVSGYVVITLLPQSSRMKLLKEMNLSVTSDNEITAMGENINQALMLLDIAEKNIKDVKLKINDVEVDSFETLNYAETSVVMPIIVDIVGKIIKGVTLGKQ